MKRIAWDIDFDRAQLSSIKLTDLFKNKAYVRLNFKIRIYNYNNIKIPISDLKTEIYYKGQLISTTSDLAHKYMTVAPNGSTVFDYPVDVYLNKNIIDILTEMLSSNTLNLSYKVKGKVFGLSFPTQADNINVLG